MWLLALITMLLLWLLLYLTVPAARDLGLPAARSRTVVIVAIVGFCVLCVFLIDVTVRLYPKYAKWALGWRLLVKTVHVCLALLAFPVAGYITLVIAHPALDEGLNTELRDRHGTSFTEVFPGLGYGDTQYYRTHGYFFRASRPTATKPDPIICTFRYVSPEDYRGDKPHWCLPRRAPAPAAETVAEVDPPAPAPAAPITSGNAKLDPHARPTGELYFVQTIAPAGAGELLMFRGYSSATASALQRAIAGGEWETVQAPAVDAERRFIKQLKRAADGLLYAAVGYPDWVDDDTVTWFASADEGKTWQQAP